MQLTERLGVPRRKPRERSAGLVEVLVDDDAGAVAKRRALLDWRDDIRKAETVKCQVADQRRMEKSDKEVGVQVEAIARQSRLPWCNRHRCGGFVRPQRFSDRPVPDRPPT